ncbi:MAG: fibronectin type III domain-containing protein, partial [Gemmatimonadales bacterium]
MNTATPEPAVARAPNRRRQLTTARPAWHYWLLLPFVAAVILLVACGDDRAVQPTEPDRPTETTVPAARAPAVPNQYIIVFRDDAPQPAALARQLADAHGLQLRHTYLHTIKGFSATVPAGRLEALQRHPLVKSVEPNTLMQLYPMASTATVLPPKPPSPPRFLVARAFDWQRIDLTWQDRSDDEEGFEIQRLGADGVYTTIATPAANATSFSDVGLEPSTIYTYQIRAFNANGESRWAKEASAATKPAPPTAPTTLTATAVDHQRIDLAWTDNSSSETGFRIERKHEPDGSFALIATVGANVTKYYNTGLEGGTTYTYRIWAFNAGGDSPYSNEATATTDAATLPAAPGDLAATAIDHQRIDLTWTDNSSDETGFRIERKQEPSGTFALIATVGANITKYYNTGLEGGTTYTYRIRAFNSIGDSPYSNETTATTAPATTPATPGNLTATAVSGDRIDLAWTDNSGDETGFRIERKTEPDGSFALIATVGANVTKYYNTGLAGGTTYTYRVRAFNTIGDSPNSNEASATTGAAPTAPGNLAATAIDYQRIDLTWTDNSSDETGFRIERKTEPDGSFALIATVGANVTKYYNTGLQSGTTYTYRVRSYNAAGESPASNEAAATTASANTPAAPSDLAATAADHQRIDLTWVDNSSDETGFRIERKTEPDGSFALIATVGADVTKYYSTGLEPGITYTYRLRAFNGVGESPNSNEATATTELAVPPAAPSDLAATALSQTWIQLTWTDNSDDEMGFRIDRKTEPDGSFALIATVGGNVTSRYDTNLEVGATYTYRVRAFNAIGESDNSNEATATTDPEPAPPAAPSGLAAATADDRRIDLTWIDNSGAEDGFTIQRKLGPQGSPDPFVDIATTASNATGFGDSGLDPETEYCYQVSAFNALGTSDFSNVACATTAVAPPPPPPGSCADTGNHDPLNGAFDLWNISKIKADLNPTWQATQQSGCEITVEYYGLDSGVDSDHPDLNVVEVRNFVAS